MCRAAPAGPRLVLTQWPSTHSTELPQEVGGGGGDPPAPLCPRLPPHCRLFLAASRRTWQQRGKRRRGSPNHPLPPPSLLLPPLREAAAEETTPGANASAPARADGELQEAASDDPPPPPPPAGGVEEGGAAMPHADSVRRAQSSQRYEGHPPLAPEVGGAQQRTLVGTGWSVWPLPPWGGRG